MSRALPCGTPSTTSISTTSASSLSAMRSAQLAPTLPAPTTVTFFRTSLILILGWNEVKRTYDYSAGPQRPTGASAADQGGPPHHSKLNIIAACEGRCLIRAIGALVRSTAHRT